MSNEPIAEADGLMVQPPGTGDDDLREPLLSGEEQREAENQPTIKKDIVFPRWVTFWRSRSLPPARMNHNVFLTIVLDIVYGISDSLWGGTVFVAYLKTLGRGRNGPVGDVEAVNGLAVLISAIPVGYLADKLGRSKVITAGGWLFVITAIIHFGIMWWVGTDEASLDKRKSDTGFVLLATVMALWGIGGGVVSGPAQALFADSTPAGERSTYYFYLFTAYLLSSCCGPLISIVLFQTLGDNWDIYDLRTVIFVGLGMELCNATLMMLFDDNKALDEEEEHALVGGGDTDNPAAASNTNGLDDVTATEGDGPKKDATGGNKDDNDEEVATDGLINDGMEDPAVIQLRKRRKWIPYITFGCSLTLALGAGMTIKFFPLFFKDEVGLSPTQVQIIYVIVPIVMVLTGKVVVAASKVLGRVQTIMISKLMGVTCLYAMVFFKGFLDEHPFVLVPVYIIRTALTNSAYPLVQSILMDFVPRNQRARWKSLESVAQFGWCGSAAMGGYLADRWDYTYTFFITAIIQTTGSLMYGLLLPLVPRKEGAATAST